MHSIMTVGSSQLRAVCSILAVAGAACSSPGRLTAQAITSIGLIVVPADAGSAQVYFAPDGAVRGGHRSGDSVPFVHQAEGRVNRATVGALWRAAHALGDSLLTRQDSVPTGGRGYNRLEIERTGREPALIVWPVGTEHPNALVRALVRLMLAHRVGGW
jgi:hypothetical protein